MYEMEQSNIAGLSHRDKKFQMERFKNILKEILDHPHNKECHNRAIMVNYKGKSNVSTEKES